MAALKKLRHRARGERGAELIEMAIVTPILLLIIAGIVDFGFLFRSWEVVTNAAREGARVGILPSYQCDPDEPEDVESRVDAYMLSAGFPDGSYTVTIAKQDVGTSAGTFGACAVHVSMDQELPSLGVFAQMFGGNFGTLPVTGMSVMRTETQALAPPTGP